MNDDQRSFTPNAADAAGVVSWVHIGDLHMEASGEQNHRDLQSIVSEINAALGDRIAFTFIPGDIADKGSASQYKAVRQAIDELNSPWCAIVGDHDVHEKSFYNFLQYMAEKTCYDFTVGKIRFFALNAFEEPDPKSFAMLPDQLAWLEAGLQGMQADESAVLLLHCYPTDLKEGGNELRRLVAEYPVRLIDMGHTHYNEIANDGRLLYTATRSTGQIEEGPVGFSITNIDGLAISWKFFPLRAMPAVMITSPSEERMIPDAQADQQVVSDHFRVRAKVFSAAGVKSIEVDFAGMTVPLVQIEGSHVYEADLSSGPEGIYPLTARLIDTAGAQAKDEIHVVVGRAAFHPPARRKRDQDNAVEAWPERGLLGTQLGPNKNGKKW